MDKNTSTSNSPSAAAVADSASAAASSKLINGTGGGGGAAAVTTTSVKLLIKASNQQFDDQIIESDLLWTVKQLKTQLSLVYPSKPLVSDQKLIYSGQLLNDALLLKDVIRSYKDVYTQNHIFHLVCMQKITPATSTTSTAPKPKVTATMTASSGSNSNVNIESDGLRQRNVTAGSASAAPQSAQQRAPSMQQAHQAQHMLNFGGMNPQVMSQWMAAAAHAAHSTATTTQCPPVGGDASGATSTASLPFSLSAQYNMQPAFVTHQAAMYNWMQQVYAQYMEHCLRLTNAADIGGNANQMPSTSSSSAAAAAAMSASAMPTMMNPFLQQMPGFGGAGTAVNPVIPPVPTSTLSSATPNTAMPRIARAPTVAAAATATANDATEQLEQQQQQQQQQEQPQQAAAAPRFPNIVQEEQENRDWLDRFFSITRCAIFLTILYFNSSPLRCFIVVIIASVIYLYHIGVLRLRQERNNNNINRNNNAAVADQIRQGVQEVQQAQAAQEQQQEPNQNNPPNRAGDANADNRNAIDNDVANEESATANAAAATTTTTTTGNDEDNSSNSVISFVRTFVVTFFTSLLPETPAL